jgi:sterol desaturase/sphingolipid hydroxylase (fatty acid hydroxylase superfamily)
MFSPQFDTPGARPDSAPADREPLPRRLPPHVARAGRHAEHHLDGDVNFGFYTDAWDRLFGTRKKVE